MKSIDFLLNSIDFLLNSINFLLISFDFLLNLLHFCRIHCFLLILLIFGMPIQHFERPFRPQLVAKRRPRSKLWLKSAKSKNIHLRRYYFWYLDPRTLHISTAYSDTLTHEPSFRPIHHFKCPFYFAVRRGTAPGPPFSRSVHWNFVSRIARKNSGLLKSARGATNRQMQLLPGRITPLNENPSLGRSREQIGNLGRNFCRNFGGTSAQICMIRIGPWD